MRTRTTTANGGDALALVPEVNTQLHAEFPAFMGTFKVRMAERATIWVIPGGISALSY